MDIDFVAVSAIVGVVLPLVVSFLKQQTWSNQLKKGFAFGLAIIAALATTGFTEGWTNLSISMVLGSLGIIIPLAQTMYTGLWEDTGIEVRLAAIGDRTAAV